MKLWKLLLAMLLATLAFCVSVTYLMWAIASEIDNNGGVKAVVERVWNGKDAK